MVLHDNPRLISDIFEDDFHFATTENKTHCLHFYLTPKKSNKRVLSN